MLELACGVGEYTVGMAQAFPALNFIGVDIKGDRIARGSQAARVLGLTNAAFLRTDINYPAEFFDDWEVNEIWIVFPDPQPRPKQAKHRLTHSRFLATYQRLLISGGTFHLKTDSPELFAYGLDKIRASSFTDLHYSTDLYSSPLNDYQAGITTKYEHRFVAMGFTINYLQRKIILVYIPHL